MSPQPPIPPSVEWCDGRSRLVAAPVSTVDLRCRSGAHIPVEQRAASEVAAFVPDGVAVANPAFDVTPARLVTAIITDRGVATRPYRAALARL